MVGILIVAHGTLGESLLECTQHIMGWKLPHLAQIAVSKQDDPGEVFWHAQQLIVSLDNGQGVLVLSDIYGGTPSNIACRLLEPGKVEGVAGVNLPMLVRAITYRNEGLEVVVKKAMSGGCDGVVHLMAGN